MKRIKYSAISKYIAMENLKITDKSIVTELEQHNHLLEKTTMSLLRQQNSLNSLIKKIDKLLDK